MIVKKTICLLCVAALVFCAAGCGASTGNQADTDAVMAAVEKFSECTSFTVLQVTELQEQVSAEGMEGSYDMHNEMLLSLITEPVPQMLTETSVRMSFEGDVVEQYTVSYIVPEDGGYAEYFSDGSEWYKATTDQADALTGLDAAVVVSTFYIDRISFGKAGEESIDGVKAIRYEGRLSGEELVGMLEANAYLSGIETMSENQQTQIRNNLVKDLDGVVVSVWVAEDSGYPLRFEVNMTDVLKEMNKSIAKSLGNKSTDEQWDISNCVITMSVKDLNSVQEIILPADAASAKLQ